MVDGEICGQGLRLLEALTFLYGWSHWHRVTVANPKYYPGKTLAVKEGPCRKQGAKIPTVGI
ncbi:MAG: hypothetical protein QXX51_08655 [Candidatus Bathyarchaeia archaeon]